MTTEGQFKKPGSNQAIPKAAQPSNTISEQDTAAHPAMPKPSPAVTRNLSVRQPHMPLSLPGRPVYQPPKVEQDTLPLATPNFSAPSMPGVASPSMPGLGSPSLPGVESPSTPPVTFPSMPGLGSPSAPNVSSYYQGLHSSQPGLRAQQPVTTNTQAPPMFIAKTPSYGKQPGMLQRLLFTGLARLQEPQPEGLHTRGMQAIGLVTGLGLAPLLALTDAFGLFVIAGSCYVSVSGYDVTIVEACLIVGLLIMMVPNLVRLLSRTPTRSERICLVFVLGICTSFVQFMSSPLHFSGFDEFLHARTAEDILRTAHLFSTNSMLPVSPFYPGLEILTNAIGTTTGLSTFYAGNIVLFSARLLMILALFLFYEQITSSSRMASIAVIIYMANPHFFFFDMLYNYETMSLPLAIFMIYILTRYGNADKNHRWVVATAWLVLISIEITHHMTSFFFDGLLLLWAGVSFYLPGARHMRIQLLSLGIFGTLLSLFYAFLLPGNPVWSYLSEYFGSTLTQLGHIIDGTLVARPLFVSSAQTAPVWDRLLMTGSAILVTFCLPFSLLILQRLHRNNAIAITFGIASLGFPLMQVFRFTSFGTEIPDRAAAFLFLPIAYMLAVLAIHFWPTRKLSRRSIALITGPIVVIFLGGFILGSGPNLSTLPGPYQVVNDSRSVEPEGIEVATWSLTYLGPDNRIAADRINQMLMSTYGDQHMVTRLGDNVDIAPIFYSPQLDDYDRELLHEGKIRYLATDIRISRGLPLVGVYFENDIPTTVISKDSLTKFNTIAQMNRLFDSGDIVIYDTSAFINGTKT